MNRLRIGLFTVLMALMPVAALIAPQPAMAVVTTNVSVPNSAWTDLGVGPLLITPTNSIAYAISDTSPAIPFSGGFKLSGNVTLTVSTTSHVWVVALTGANTTVVVAPVLAGAGSGAANLGTTAPLVVGVTATTGALSVTLPAAVGKTTWLCGFLVTSGGTTAPLAVQGTITGTPNPLPFTYVFVSAGQGIVGTALPACIPGSAPNTAITVSVPAGGAGTAASLAAWGYQG